MDNSKHTHYRYNILDKCFRRLERHLNFQELIDEVNAEIAELYSREGISVRTFKGDKHLFHNAISGFGVPLEGLYNINFLMGCLFENLNKTPNYVNRQPI